MTIFKFNKESYFYNELPGIVIITAIGKLQAGAVQNQTAAVFGVSTSTISKLKAKYNRQCQRPTSKWAHFLSLSAFTIFRQSATDSQSRFSRGSGRWLATHSVTALHCLYCYQQDALEPEHAGTLCSAINPDSAYSSWIIGSKCGVWHWLRRSDAELCCSTHKSIFLSFQEVLLQTYIKRAVCLHV